MTIDFNAESPREVAAVMALMQGLTGTAEKAAPAKRTKTKTKQVPAPEAPDAPDAPATEEEITLDDVKSLLAEKTSKHRPKIKAWFIKNEVKNVPSLSPALYGSLVEFLNSL